MSIKRSFAAYVMDSDDDSDDESDSYAGRAWRQLWWNQALERRAPVLATGDGSHGQPELFGAATNYGADRGLAPGVFYSLFRFAPPEIPRLMRVLGIPRTLRGSFGVCDGEEALLIYLRRLSRADDLIDLKVLFHRCVGAISGIIQAVGKLLLPIALAKLEHFDGAQWGPWLSIFAAAIHAKGAPLDRCFGFLDGTFIAMCRPGRDGYRGHFQRTYYSGYKHQHGCHYQGILLPNGLLAELNGPWAGGVFNDISIVAASQLLRRLWNACVVGGVLFYLFGDSGYSNSPCIIVPFPKTATMSAAERRFNRKMSAIRVPNEWSFGHIKQLFPLIDYDHKLRLGSMPVGGLYLTAALLTNCHCCLYGSQTASYFGVPAPNLEVYMS